MLKKSAALGAWLVLGCAGMPRSPSADSSAARVQKPAPAPISSSVAAAPAVAAPAPAALDVRLEQELTVPVTAIALGDGARIAVLSETPYVAGARGFRPLPLPHTLRARPDEKEQLGIFFGRDNEPRIMGTRRSNAAEISVYLRHTSSGWRDGREEIGQLGGTTRGGLWGVLGSLDPELVCRAGSVCIIKRTSGWATAPAGPAPRLVQLQAGTLWGLDASGLANIDARGWAIVLAAPSWSEPRAFWASSDEAWVATARELFHHRDGAWSEERTPIAEPTAFWGSRRDSVWMVGAGGAAHFDGQRWRAATACGPLRAIAGRSDSQLWFGGDAGLFRVHHET